MNELVDMPDLTLDRLFRFLREGEGTLPQSAREHDFRQLREDEVARVEAAYAAAFGEDVALPPPPTP
ncbi:hypothetical protein [Azorhizobium sp. AG788]|uniref:hypothetical protein n=1 Tax=Azorhizobium sp. AG788 TaxID=2183897 RepID=UPI00105CB72A|nr:hypothetical protein [Azorhizobium sp. AG788]